MPSNDGQVTMLLKAMREGDATAEQRLLPLVYHELHRLARSYMRRERLNHTLQATALINEAYLRLAGGEVDWKNREHFIGIAAQVMRRVLVDHARAHNAEIRGGGLKRVDLDEDLVLSSARNNELVQLDEALHRLADSNARQARVVELHYFAGLSMEEIAAMLHISSRSVKHDWSLARIWLFEELRTKPELDKL
jgi:RNA polymerase sigma factor (TIGR02999 family)